MRQTIRRIIQVSVVLVSIYFIGHSQSQGPTCPSVTQIVQSGTTLAPMNNVQVNLQLVGNAYGSFASNQVGAATTAINNLMSIPGMNNQTPIVTTTSTMPSAPTTDAATHQFLRLPSPCQENCLG